MPITVQSRSANYDAIVATWSRAQNPYVLLDDAWAKDIHCDCWSAPADQQRCCSERAKDAAVSDGRLVSVNKEPMPISTRTHCRGLAFAEDPVARLNRPVKGRRAPQADEPRLFKKSEPKIREENDLGGSGTLPSAPPGEAWAINSIIEQLANGTIGAAKFVDILKDISYWWRYDLWPWPERLDPPDVDVVDVPDNCTPPVEVPEWCEATADGTACECPDFAVLLQGDQLACQDSFPDMCDEQLYQDIVATLQAAFDFLLLNLDIVEWLECLLGIESGCISDYLSEAQTASISTTVAGGEFKETRTLFTIFGLPVNYTVTVGMDPSGDGVNPLEMNKDGQLVAVLQGDRGRVTQAWAEAYVEALKLEDAAPGYQERILACVLSQVAASMLGALAAGLDCLKGSPMDDVENRIQNSFLWAIAQRFPCVSEWEGCDEYADDSVWMSTLPPEYGVANVLIGSPWEGVL